MKLDVLNDKLSIDPQSVIKKLAPISLYKMKNTNLYSESNKIFLKYWEKYMHTWIFFF